MNIFRPSAFFFISIFISSYTAASEIDNAIKYGQLLTSAVQNKSHIKYKKLSQYKEIKAFLNSQKCKGVKYKAYIVGPKEKQYFYLVASKGKNVIFGRHFKTPINNKLIDVSEFKSSTNSCLNLGSVKQKVASMYATHLQPYPNEFHVMQSNLHSIPIYIKTTTDIFLIENNHISPIEIDSPKKEESVLSDKAPKDHVTSLSSKEQMDAFFKAQEPYNKQALDSYPQAKNRFLAGLPKGESFFLTTRLRDKQGRVEQVFILVDSIIDGTVSGIIYNEIGLVSGYKNRQRYDFPETEIYDWLISKPNGSEEGNFVGKYIESLQ